jgi:RimJ/RimL family protein N-acetyltransferase
VITLEPVILTGTHVRLEPLSWAHEDDLVLAGADPEITRFMPVRFEPRENLHAWLEASLRTAATGAEIPFAVVNLADGRAIGSTRFMDIRREHDAVEIGYTWYARSFWRTAVNTECKYLLMCHLFDSVGCGRVSLKTDLLNERSQRGIERLGAVREGVLRKHMIVREGRSRDTVYYSVIDSEWPAVKARLEGFIERGAVPRQSP